MPVTGNVSLYLDFYYGTVVTPDGVRKSHRKYEYLDLFLISKPRTPLDRQHNKETLNIACAIEAKRRLEIKESQHGFIPAHRQQQDFISYFENLVSKRKSEGSTKNYHSTLQLLKDFAGKAVSFKAVNDDFCQDFKDFIDQSFKRNGEPLNENTKENYFNKFKSVLLQAVKERIIAESPAKHVDNFETLETDTSYLLLAEIKQLANTSFRYRTLRNAFLFSCLTGLRYSDIKRLQYVHLERFNERPRIVFRQQKTKAIQYHDISHQAIKLLPVTVGSPKDFVFDGLTLNTYYNGQLQDWINNAGIEKKVTFHCARHSFAVNQLILGTDIYTLSKLLGHKNLKTTQGYAKIVDSLKQTAIDKIPDIAGL